MDALFKAELRPVDLLLMVVACVGAAAFTWQALTFRDYQPDEPPAANFLKLAEWCKFHPDKMFQTSRASRLGFAPG